MSLLTFRCKMQDNGFEPMNLSECRKTLHCDEDQTDCGECTVLDIVSEPRKE